MQRTFYLWDMANTLFPEKWNEEKSGFENYDAYVKFLGYDLKTISPKNYEWAYEVPYKQGLFVLTVAKGFQEVLNWAKENYAFTTGNKKQIDWRAENFLTRYGFDIRDYFKQIHTTFDYGNTNKKTVEMLVDILKKKSNEGYTAAVYTDDKPANCQFFLKAIDAAKKQGIEFKARVYNMKNDKSDLKKDSKRYYEIGNLLQLLANEKSLAK